MNQRTTPNGNGSTRTIRTHETPPQLPERALPPIARSRPEAGKSTGEALVAVARDTLDVATEMLRDGVSLAKLETQRAISEMSPRVAWGAITIVCAATAAVCGVIAIMIALGALIPSIAGRLAILAGALFLVAFFGGVRAMRPSPREHALPVSAREAPIDEGQRSEEPSRLEQGARRTNLPPTNLGA